MTGGILGLIGVIVSLFFSYRLHKENKDFQKRSNIDNNNFQWELNDENKRFQSELAKKDVENKIWMNKYNLLIKLISYRYQMGSDEYKSAMNALPAVFYDSHEVMQAIKGFYDYSELPLANKNDLIANEKMVKIYMEIFKDLGIEQNVDEVFLYRTFNATSN